MYKKKNFKFFKLVLFNLFKNNLKYIHFLITHPIIFKNILYLLYNPNQSKLLHVNVFLPFRYFIILLFEFFFSLQTLYDKNLTKKSLF